MSMNDNATTPERIRNGLRSNARKSYAAMLQRLDESPVSTQFLTQDVLFSVAAQASGLRQMDAATCKAKFAKQFAMAATPAPEELMGNCLQVMPKEMRELTMDLIPEGLKERTQQYRKQQHSPGVALAL